MTETSTHSDAAPRGEGSSGRASRTIGLLVAAYVALVVGLALTGRFTFVVKTAILPAIVLAAAFTGRFRSFVRDWAPFLGFVILFDCLRGLVFGLITRYGLPYYAAYAIDAEKAMFGGWTLPTLLQGAFLRDGTIGAFEKGLVIVHGSHFVAFLLFGLAVWMLRPAAFRQYAIAVVVLLSAGLLAYLAVPTVPPWMASDLHLIPPILHVSAAVYNVVAPGIERTFSVNPIAAMPSLHTAIPVLCSLIGWHHFRLRALPFVAYTLTVCFAIAYLGEHYYVDILAGAALSFAVYFAVYRTAFVERLAGRLARSEAPGSRWARLRPVALGLSFVLAGELAGQAAIAIRRPFQLDEAFVQRELVGRSDLAPLFLSRFAAQRGDFPAARAHAERAARELTREQDRRIAAELLLRLPQAR